MNLNHDSQNCVATPMCPVYSNTQTRHASFCGANIPQFILDDLCHNLPWATAYIGQNSPCGFGTFILRVCRLDCINAGPPSVALQFFHLLLLHHRHQHTTNTVICLNITVFLLHVISSVRYKFIY